MTRSQTLISIDMVDTYACTLRVAPDRFSRTRIDVFVSMGYRSSYSLYERSRDARTIVSSNRVIVGSSLECEDKTKRSSILRGNSSLFRSLDFSTVFTHGRVCNSAERSSPEKLRVATTAIPHEKSSEPLPT